METQFIAVIEDNPADLQLSRLAFSDMGLDDHLIHFPDGESFLDFMDNHGTSQLQYVLLDLNMPGLTGFDLLKQLRTIPTCNDLPIIVFTTSSNANHVRTCYDLGANAYVVKPLNFTEYFKAVQAVNGFWGDSEPVLTPVRERV